MCARRRLLTRRRALLGLGGAAAALVVPTGAVFGATYVRARVDAVGRVPFTRRLAVPPLEEGTVDVVGVRGFDLAVQEGESDFGRGVPTRTWGVNGAYLGPTLRMRRGETVRMRVENRLAERTTLHWHGMHLPAEADGGPHQMVDPGRAWLPQWSVDQPAATTWYHPHLHDVITGHVYRGVTGMMIVDDDESAGLGLPREYGVDDLPVIVQDKKFTADGQLDTGDGFMRLTGLLGDTVMVNGTIGAFHDVTTERVRLRLLNASTARIYNLGFADDRPFDLVATDGGLLPAPVAVTRVQLSPGERAEVVVRLAPGGTAMLRSHPADLRAFAYQARVSGGDDRFDVLELRAAPALRPSPAVPARLAADPFEGVRAPEGAPVRYLQLQGDAINGRSMDMNRVDAVIGAGAVEVWEVSNGDGYPHNFHVHDVRFRVLDVDGEAPPPVASGPKDTVFVPPGTTVRLLIPFGDLTDPDSPYMYHCHLLRHEDGGMMGQFLVVGPGQEPETVDHEHTWTP